MGDEIRMLRTVTVTKENFAPYGDIMYPYDDCDLPMKDGETPAFTFPPEDGNKGNLPLLWMMRLRDMGLVFDTINRHQRVTQAFGVVSDDDWYMGFAPPSEPGAAGMDFDPSSIVGFRIPPKVMVKLHCGTWHAGPYFARPGSMTFFNLECRATNEEDKDDYVFTGKCGYKYMFDVAMAEATRDPEEANY